MDLVLMDVIMPHMNGLDTYVAMRAHPNGQAVPIVLSSAVADPGTLDPGITVFLPKPSDLDHPLRLVARLLSEGTPR